MRVRTEKTIQRSFSAILLLLAVFAFQPANVFAFDDEWSEEKYQPVEADDNTSGSAAANLNGFFSILNQKLLGRGWKKEDLCDDKDIVISRIMREYGSVYVVNNSVTPPPVCMFTSAEEVEKFQQKVGFAGAEIGGAKIELQSAAMAAFLKARDEALQAGFAITPRDGAEAARRNYADTIRLWKSRFDPACDHWVAEERLTSEQAEKLRALPIKEQVAAVLRLESQGIYFNKFFNNSILYSVAAPGTSQHLSMLALDINEYDNAAVRDILAKYGWFQTVKNDVPHFTFLGHQEAGLQSAGLKAIFTKTGKYWIPNV